MEKHNGKVIIRIGKGGTPGTVYLVKHSRIVLGKYLQTQSDENTALWVSTTGERLKHNGLQTII